MRRLAVVGLAALAGCGGGSDGSTAGRVVRAAPAPHPPAPHVATVPGRPRPGERWGALLRRATVVLRAPRVGARVAARIPGRTRFGSTQVLAVVGQRGRWIGVVAPELGNGRVGWVRYPAVRLLRETWAIDVDLSARRAVLQHLGRRYFAFPVAVGSAVYATPTGLFGVTDRLRTGGPGSPYGCCVLALSGRQPHVAQDWPGGDRIAIHGTDEPWTVGTAASHGCLRATERAMHLLMARVPLGTPVRIHA